MRITALQTQATDPNRVNIFVDDTFFMGANAFIVLKLGLRVNQELTPALRQELEREEALQKAVERAINFLSFRPRSREEIRRYLRKKETPTELLDAVMEKLEQMDLVNDESFTEFWIDARDRFRPKGAQALKSELRMKGVKREVVDELVNDEQDEEKALRAAQKKAEALIKQPEMDYQTFRARLGSFLQRRGFSFEVCKKTTQTLWEELKTDDVDDEDDY